MFTRPGCRRPPLAALALVGATLVAAPVADAATTIGAVTPQPGGLNPPLTLVTTVGTYVQTADDPTQPSYAAPTAGVITSWSTRLGSMAPTPVTFKLKIVRSTAAGQKVVGESAGQFTGSSSAQLDATFPARVSVDAGDRIGLATPPTLGFSINEVTLLTGGTIAVAAGEASGSFVPDGTTSNARLQLSAKLEPDADRDGYGDETQDPCPTDVLAHSLPCAAPAPTAPPTPPATPVPSPPADRIAPAVSAVTVDRRELHLMLGEAATLTINVRKLLDGRRVGTRCVKPTAKLRRAATCTRRGAPTSRTVLAPTGRSTVLLSPKALRPGKYEISVIATDAAGNASPVLTKPLTVRG